MEKIVITADNVAFVLLCTCLLLYALAAAYTSYKAGDGLLRSMGIAVICLMEGAVIAYVLRVHGDRLAAYLDELQNHPLQAAGAVLGLILVYETGRLLAYRRRIRPLARLSAPEPFFPLASRQHEPDEQTFLPRSAGSASAAGQPPRPDDEHEWHDVPAPPPGVSSDSASADVVPFPRRPPSSEALPGTGPQDPASHRR